MCICLSVPFSVIAYALTLLEDRQAGGGRLGHEGGGWCLSGGRVKVEVVGGGGGRGEGAAARAGCSITASPGWGSRYKALTAPRSLSLLCDKPLQSCPRPRQLQQDKGTCEGRREREGAGGRGTTKREKEGGRGEKKDCRQ